MTECDLIAAVGATPKVELGTNERGERTAVLSYAAGDHAGIYRFNSGLLVSIEAPETPPAVAKKPKRKPRSAKS